MYIIIFECIVIIIGISAVFFVITIYGSLWGFLGKIRMRLKDNDTVVQNYLQSIINKVDLFPQKLTKQSPSEIKHSNNKYPEIKQTITDIQMKVESGFQINGLSLNQWDICRTEIEKILQRQLSKKQQKRIKILLERIKSSLYSKKQDDENIDSETTLVALEQLVIVNIEDK